MLKKVKNTLLYILYLILIVFICLEILLRIFNPFPNRIVNNKIVLPKNQIYNLPNNNFQKLKKNSVHTKNSLGFRGSEWSNSANKIKILTVGGSTTECFFVDDKLTWSNNLSDLLGNDFLLNNAGLNGHSSVGHIKLLEDNIKSIKPDFIIFLIGINDLALCQNGTNKFDEHSKSQKALIFISEYSRLVNMIHSFYRSYQAKKMGLSDTIEWDLLKRSKEAQSGNNVDQISQNKQISDCQVEYGIRIQKLISICNQERIKPIFLTQPLLFGDAIDPITNLDLGKFKVYNQTGKEYYADIHIFNKTLINVCNTNNVKYVDLAELLPKSSAFFYDDMHFSDMGCKKVAELLYNDLKTYWKSNYP